MTTPPTPLIAHSIEGNRFVLRLEALKDAGRLRSAARAEQRTESSLRRSERMVDALDFLGEVNDTLRAVLVDLGRELPCPPALSRGFFDGRYLLAARLDEALSDHTGRKSRYFTRLSFLLEPRAQDNCFLIEVRTTVREHDLPSEQLKIAMTSAGLSELKAFAEGRALEFARNYFGESRLSRAAGEPCELKPDLAV